MSHPRSVAFLSASCMQPGASNEREDSWEHELEFMPLRAACHRSGIELVTVLWDDPELDAERIGSFDAFVIGTTWDYTSQAETFLARLERIAALRPLLNPLPVLRWNLTKTYLVDLEREGAPIVPTLWRERADASTISAAFDELGTDELVVKPEVGASAWRQARVRRGTTLPPAEELPPGRTMIQPFLPAAASEGEYSFVYFEGAFSHCARKIPAAGDYRVQSMFGAREEVHQPARDELELTRRVLDAATRVTGHPLFQARVDMLRGLDGELALMELELIEPYLYPEQGPKLGEAFADALVRRLGPDRPPSKA